MKWVTSLESVPYGLTMDYLAGPSLPPGNGQIRTLRESGGINAFTTSGTSYRRVPRSGRESVSEETADGHWRESAFDNAL